ncbi:GDNF family receptor alpha-1 [Turdus rufiventris]|nr:GDNF family receptor alpha-1 [Turdus rufiventris]
MQRRRQKAISRTDCSKVLILLAVYAWPQGADGLDGSRLLSLGAGAAFRAFGPRLQKVSGLPGGERLDCVKASDQCLKEQSCSTKFRTLRQCVAGKESNFSRATGLEAKDECRSAMEALKQKSLYNCRCKRGMKKEKNCLRIYWSMYQSLQGNDLLEDSPYEPVNSRLSDIFRLAPIVSGQLYGLLSFSEKGAKDRGTASGVGGITKIDRVTEEGSRIGLSESHPIPGMW